MKFKRVRNLNMVDLVLIAVICVETFIVLKFLNVAMDGLRPIADDYCNATSADMNIFANLNFWMNLWSGDIFQILISYVFIGFPTLHLPLGIGSAFALISSISFLAAVLNASIAPQNAKRRFTLKKFISGYLIFISTLTSWIVFWWLPVFFASDLDGEKNRAEQFLMTILSWQTVNGPYVLQSAISFLIVIYFLKRKFERFKLFYAIIIGILIGTSGYVLALSLTVLVILETMAHVKLINATFVKQNLDRIFFVIFSIIGMQISSNSTGARNRKSYLPQNPDLGSIFSITTSGIKSWFELLFSSSTFYTLIFGVFLFAAISHISKNVSSNLNANAYRLLFMSISTLLLSKISEIFSYVAFWHQIFSQVFLYLAVILFGGLIQQYVTLKRIEINFLMSVTALGCLSLVSIYGLSQAELRIENRKAQWEVGPASAPNGQPADREIPWINDCWIELAKLKNS